MTTVFVPDHWPPWVPVADRAQMSFEFKRGAASTEVVAAWVARVRDREAKQ